MPELICAQCENPNLKGLHICGKDPKWPEKSPGISSVLDEAAEIVDGPRQDNYGHPKRNLQRVADLWTVVMDRPVTPMQVALCLIQLKIAREVHCPRRDNLVDIAGYARVMEMLSE